MGISERFFRACEYFKLVDDKTFNSDRCVTYRFDYDSAVDECAAETARRTLEWLNHFCLRSES